MVGNFSPQGDIPPGLKILGSGSNFFVKIQTAHLVAYMRGAMEENVIASHGPRLWTGLLME